MAFIPTNDEPHHKGVSMSVRSQLPYVANGESRDVRASREAIKFSDGNAVFPLNRSADAAPYRPNKVKTYDPRGSGNIISPEVAVQSLPKRIVGPRVLEEYPHRFASNDHLVRDEAAQATADSPSGVKFSQQRVDRIHKVLREPSTTTPPKPVRGFPGLGESSPDRVHGRAGAPNFPPSNQRPHGVGMKHSGSSNTSTVTEHMEYQVGEADRKLRRRGPGARCGAYDGTPAESVERSMKQQQSSSASLSVI